MSVSAQCGIDSNPEQNSRFVPDDLTVARVLLADHVYLFSPIIVEGIWD